MALNEHAKATIEKLTSGSADVLSPDHIGVTKASFPVLLDGVMKVTASGDGAQLVGLGFFGGELCTVWASATGPSGYAIHSAGTIHLKDTPPGVVRKWVSKMRNLLRFD